MPDNNEANEANEALQNAINAVGAACELTGMIFKNLQQNGFTREEAFEMSCEYLCTILTAGSGE